jgi:hypothetical protein
LRASAAAVIPPGRWCFGACDEFLPGKTWSEVAAGLAAGSLALALLTGEDLAGALGTPGLRRHFLSHFTVMGDIPPALESKLSLARRIFIVTPRGQGAAGEANRILILIECKSTVNTVKSLLQSMPNRPIQVEELTLRARTANRGPVALVRLALPQSIDAIRLTGRLLTACKAAGGEVSILGVYPGTENGG